MIPKDSCFVNGKNPVNQGHRLRNFVFSRPEAFQRSIPNMWKNKKGELLFAALRGSIWEMDQHLPRPVLGSGEVGLSGFAGLVSFWKILLRTSSKSAKKFPPLTCAISFTFSSVFIIIAFLRFCASSLNFLSGRFTLDTC